GKSVSVDDISAELRRKATVPNDWPEHNAFAEYIFARAWHVPLDISKTEESIVDVEGCNDLQLLVDQAKDAEISVTEIKLRALNDSVDLFDCLAIPRPGSKKVEEIPVKTPAKRKAQSTYLEEHAEESQGENLPKCHLLLPLAATFLEEYQTTYHTAFVLPLQAAISVYRLQTNP
ncbi:hypothetical protein DFQ29_001672, partial [Apophysomyces sp. BC1021]